MLLPMTAKTEREPQPKIPITCEAMALRQRQVFRLRHQRCFRTFPSLTSVVAFPALRNAPSSRQQDCLGLSPNSLLRAGNPARPSAVQYSISMLSCASLIRPPRFVKRLVAAAAGVIDIFLLFRRTSCDMLFVGDYLIPQATGAGQKHPSAVFPAENTKGMIITCFSAAILNRSAHTACTA